MGCWITFEPRYGRCADGRLPVFFYTGLRFPPVKVTAGTDPDENRDSSETYEVRIIDNDYNTYQEVIEITILALGVTWEQAYAIAWEVDHRGWCVVAHAALEDAQAIAAVIQTIGIEVEVNRVPAPA